MSTKQMIGVLTVLAAVMLLAACAQSPGKPIGTLTVVPLGASSTPTRAPRPPTPTPVPATVTITPRPPTATLTATAVPTTLTFTSVPPTVTPSSQPSATVTVTPSPVVGPTVKIIYPTSEDPATVGQEVAVQFIATSDIGITDIELWVDGVRNNTMPDVNFTEQEITDTITWIPETAGEHTLAVLVYDKKGDIGEATVMVTAH